MSSQYAADSGFIFNLSSHLQKSVLWENLSSKPFFVTAEVDGFGPGPEIESYKDTFTLTGQCLTG